MIIWFCLKILNPPSNGFDSFLLEIFFRPANRPLKKKDIAGLQTRAGSGALVKKPPKPKGQKASKRMKDFLCMKTTKRTLQTKQTSSPFGNQILEITSTSSQSSPFARPVEEGLESNASARIVLERDL